MTRRDALKLVGTRFGMVGLAGMLQGEGGSGPLASKAAHFPAKTKNVIFLFLNEGMSQIDTFDPKPMLTKHDAERMHGQTIKTYRNIGRLPSSPLFSYTTLFR